MILADTSIWIDHFRLGDQELQKALDRGQIVIHPWVIAELALGSLRDRNKTLAMLALLPQAQLGQMGELRLLIEARRLYSLGIGLTDAQLIGSVFLSPGTRLWTRDQRLRKVAQALGIHANLS